MQKNEYNIETTDTRIKWGLLIVSLLTLLLLTASALKENIYPEWREHRLSYAHILQAKATDDRGHTIAHQFEIGIDQNVLPELRSVDRCITCHTGLDDPRMVNEQQPFTTHPGTFLNNHPPERFGCTLCHQGQGRATETQEAHGFDPHWLHPMLEKRFLYASCEKCHHETALYGTEGLLTRTEDGDTPTVGAALMQKGKDYYEQSGCANCHMRKGIGGIIGPDISFVGDKTKHQFDFSHLRPEEPHEVPYWLQVHFLEPARVSPTTTMPTFGFTEEDAAALTAYVLSFRDNNIPTAYKVRLLPNTDQPTNTDNTQYDDDFGATEEEEEYDEFF